MIHRRATTALLTTLLLWACDNTTPPPPPPTDAGPRMDAGPRDAGMGEAGPMDAGDAGDVDAGDVDAGDVDAGDATPPMVRCVGPDPDTMQNHIPGEVLPVHILVSDPSLDRVTVNGSTVTPDALGLVRVELRTNFGINSVSIVAENMDGAISRKVCSWLIADEWHDDGEVLSDGSSLTLSAAAFDDADTGTTITSVDDVLRAALAGGMGVEAVHARLSTSPTIKPRSVCDHALEAFPTEGTCLVLSSIRYLSSELLGEVTVTLRPVADGLDVTVTMTDLRALVEITGDERATTSTASPLSYGPLVAFLETDQPIDIGSLTLNATYEVFTNAMGQLELGPPIDGLATVSGVVPNFGRLDGNPEDILGMTSIRSVVQTSAQNAIVSSVDPAAISLREGIATELSDRVRAALDEILSSLAVRTTPATIMIPNLAGDGMIRLDPIAAHGDVTTDTSAMIFRVETGYIAPGAMGDPGRGLPISPDRRLSSSSEPIAAAIATDAINHALFRQWRAGGFSGLIDPAGIAAPPTIMSTCGAVTTGLVVAPSRLSIDTNLPPIVRTTSGTGAILGLGGIEITIDTVDPGLGPPYDAELHLRVAATVEADLDVMGVDPTWTNIDITSLQFAADDALSDADRNTVCQLVTLLIWHMGNHALNTATPPMPIASFEIPASLSAYGLVAGTELGITPLANRIIGDAIITEGPFGAP